MRAQAQLHGLDLAVLQEMQRGGEIDPAYIAGLMAGAKIGRLELSFTDRGAIDRLAAMRAGAAGGDAGKDRDAVIEDALRGLERQKAAYRHDIVKQAIDALAVFVRNRGTIALKAAPKTPVPLLRLALTRRTGPAGMDRLARELGLSVEAR